MSKKSIRIISTLLTIVMVLMMLSTVTFAKTEADAPIYDGSNTQNLLDNLKGNGSVEGSDKLVSAGNKIIGSIRIVGVITAVIILMVLGIKYMMGSSEEKASYKKTMMPYFIGALLLFGASTFAGMIISLANSL